MSKQNSSIMTGALILTVNSFIVRIIGFIFRIYLSNIIGSQGMGLYQLVLTLYMLVVMLGTAGISVAVSRLIAEQIALNHFADAKRTLKISIQISLLISCAVGILLFIMSPFFANSVLKDTRTLLSLKILAPSMPFIAVTSCYKGYFFAVNNTAIPAISQLIEQFVKIGVIIGIMGICIPMGLEYTCAGIVFGMTIGEVISLLSIYLMFLYKKNKYLKKGTLYEKGLTKQILAISVPVAISGTLTSALRLVENVCILSGFRKYGTSETDSTGIYGMLKGMAMPLLFFPSAILSAVSTTLIPDVSASKAKGDEKAVARSVSMVLKFTTILSIPVAGIFLAFPNELGTAIYGDPQVGQMLKVLSFICPFMYLEMVISGVLNALNQQVSSLIYNVSDCFLRIGMIYFIVPVYGMNGILLVITISNLFTSLLKLNKLLKITSIRFRLNNWFIKPVIAVSAATLTIKFISSKWLYSLFPLWAALIIGIIVILSLYFILIFLLGSIGKREIDWIKRCFNRNRRVSERETQPKLLPYSYINS